MRLCIRHRYDRSNRLSSLRQKALQMQQQENFDRLDDILKLFIKSSAEGETALTRLVAQQAAETRAFVNAESHQIRQQLQGWRDEEADHAACERLLETLKCENMNLRLNEIQERHNETFEWIFSEDPEAPYTSLPHWLEADQGIYWISGKAGSGKSTFMKFLCEDSRTHMSLRDWHEGTMILSFFFLEIWVRRTKKLQRSAYLIALSAFAAGCANRPSSSYPQSTSEAKAYKRGLVSQRGY